MQLRIQAGAQRWSLGASAALGLCAATLAASAPVRLASIHGGTYGPILAAAANGRIALTLLTGNHSPIQYATRTPAGRWSTLTRVGTGDNPEIAVSSDGPVTLVWETFNQSGHYKLQTRTEQ